MSDPLKREFRRLMRSSNPTNVAAPWWARWLLEAVLIGAVVYGVAWSLDAVTVWLGWPAWALPGLGRALEALLAIPALGVSVLPALGLLLLILGVLMVIAGRRGAGLAWLVAGTIVASLPELLTALG